MTKEFPMKRLFSLLATLTVALTAAPIATAGTYNVVACTGGLGNASWAAEPTYWGAAYSSCPGDGIVTRMSHHGSERAPYGASARHVIAAPPTTNIVRFQADVKQDATNGWWAGLVDARPQWVFGGNARFSPAGYTPVSVGVYTPQLFAQATCGASSCPTSALHGIFAMRNVVVTIEDRMPPGVTITGGSATVSGWRRGPQTLLYAASDATGIRRTDVFVDRQRRGGEPGTCRDWALRQCDDMPASQALTPADFGADGRHDIAVYAYDAAGNEDAAVHTLYTDNTPPGQPASAELVGGGSWHAQNSFAARWVNPRQSAAPIAAARYRICPSANSAGDLRRCVDGSVRGRNVQNLSGLRVPAAGDWRLSLWLEDAAGNADPERSIVLTGLRLDQTPPNMTFERFNPSDPMRVRVSARDAPSGIASASIEAKRQGESVWRSLPTALDARGFTALLDDERLPRGRYEVRARAVDRAGNERTIDHDQDGDLATRRLPVRVGTRLVVGKPTRVRARGSHGRRKYRTILAVKPSARFGRTIPLRGRLTTPGGNPLAGVGVEVWERVKLPAANWRRIGQLRTTGKGRFRFRALRGPSRLLRFRYPGTATIRARSTVVDLRVRAVTSMHASRTRVINGEEIRFSGRLRGRQEGALGKLIHLQVYTRGRWSTFATPRADRQSGRWRLPYRFTATRGSVTYRFRALVPRENSFPYETGTSRTVRVAVRGL